MNEMDSPILAQVVKVLELKEDEFVSKKYLIEVGVIVDLIGKKTLF